MANIAVNNYCNLQCPYCFANRYITEEQKQSISLDQLDRIFEFLSRSSVGRIGLIGGEPTLHPNFSNILERTTEFCYRYNTHCSIFTNGIRLYDYARLLKDNVGCLINLNHPDVVGPDNWNSILRSLERMKLCSTIDRANFGINLYHTMLDYDYIFDLARNYNKETLRVSYVAPTCKFSDVIKEEYYETAKEIFIPFLERIKSEGLIARIDCNCIPKCYFTDKELELVESVTDGYHDYCEPVIDITADFKATACFGAYELFDLSKFDNIQQLERYLRYKKLYPLVEANCEGKCKTCEKHENLSCQGGCLAFSNK